MIIEPTSGREMGYSELVELFGEDLGWSLTKSVKSVGRGIKKAGGVLKRNAGNIAVAATVVPTAGGSLLFKKNVRKGVGNAASFTARKIVAPIAQSRLVQKATGQAIRGFVPGGAAGLNLVSSLQPKKKTTMALTTSPTAAANVRRAFRGAVQAASDTLDPKPAFPIVPVALGAAGLVGLLMFMQGRKK